MSALRPTGGLRMRRRCRSQKLCTDFPIHILNRLVGAKIRCKISASYPIRSRAQTGRLGFDPRARGRRGIPLRVGGRERGFRPPVAENIEMETAVEKITLSASRDIPF